MAEQKNASSRAEAKQKMQDGRAKNARRRAEAKQKM
jgi:hypothetical protein